MDELKIPCGDSLFKFAKDLWPFHRSLIGRGNEQTLLMIKELLPNLEIWGIPSGTKALDWDVPNEWVIREAWIKCPSGKRICDISVNNLHIVAYSRPIHEFISLEALQQHLHSVKEQPEAVPYVTSYYDSSYWGFCISENERAKLSEGIYEVFIDAEFIPGDLLFGELFIKGDRAEEILVSTYICHPAMANNELSGPVVSAHLAQTISHANPIFSYRFIFLSETIGSVAYIEKKLSHLKQVMVGGLNLTCIGDERGYSFIPSRANSFRFDALVSEVSKQFCSRTIELDWSCRGSDERQYCAPGVDLPMVTLMRSGFKRYPEYHTSLDQLGTVVTADGLEGGLKFAFQILKAWDNNFRPVSTMLCEPQLGKRGLYPKIASKNHLEFVRIYKDILTYADGSKDLIAISKLLGVSWEAVVAAAKLLMDHGLVAQAPENLHSLQRS
jgi:aminopeptidase-like protein